jgi:tetratricopeptide (TPR) repeat protein
MTKEESRQYFDLFYTHPEQYLRIAEETIGKYPKDVTAYLECARYYVVIEQYDEALRYLDKASAFDPGKFIPFNRGEVLRQAGRYEEALLAFNEGNPDRRWFGSGFYVNRATCYAYLGNLEAALAECANIADDYDIPSIHGEFGGTKTQIIETVKRVARGKSRDDLE